METNQIPTPSQDFNAPMPPSSPQGSSNNNGMAILAYLGILIIVPFLTDAKNDPFVKFHIKQGLVLIIAWIIMWFFQWFIIFIPIIGWLFSSVLWLGIVAFIIIGIMNAASGKTKELPIIGQFARSFNF